MTVKDAINVAIVSEETVWIEEEELQLMKHNVEEIEFIDVKFNLVLLLLLVMVG